MFLPISTGFHDVPWCSTMFYHVPQGSRVFYIIPWHSTMFYGASITTSVKFLWGILVYHDWYIDPHPLGLICWVGVRICDPNTQSGSWTGSDVSVRIHSSLSLISEWVLLHFQTYHLITPFTLVTSIHLVLSHPSLFPLIFLYVCLTYPDFLRIPISSVPSLFPLSSI